MVNPRSHIIVIACSLVKPNIYLYFAGNYSARLLLICRGDASAQSLPQAAKLPVQGKVAFGKNACVFAESRKRSFTREKARKSLIPQGERPLPTSLRSATYHGPTGPISLKTAHCAVFRALDAPEPLPSVAGEGFWRAGTPFAFPSKRSLRFRWI